MDEFHQGGFTLPGEAGCEALTLQLAKRWGADVIRDSDGTKLSDDILNAGYDIYATLCVIREHNAFLTAHPEAQQQVFLTTEDVIATGTQVALPLMDAYFAEQFTLNDSADALRYWQVYDRTTQTEVPRNAWHYDGNGQVIVDACQPWHLYSASFLCYRIWEEINMYNHTTNHWQSEHLRQLDPRCPVAWDYLTGWLEQWCKDHPDANVVRFTSMFYNFVWIWGSSERKRNLFTDWGSYDFTVSPAALDAFARERGYALTAEDFIHRKELQATHMPPTAAKRDYMDFIQAFVAEKGKVLVDIVHRWGKRAYVFYDDSWVGVEPWGKRFSQVGFDGLIKCVFSGFECRLCAGADVPVHELRLHPYLFPVGLGGMPTFAPGGHPAQDALSYWLHVRRALLRQCVDRIGLGGYLHLTEDFPDFVDAIEQIGVEFRRIKAMHANGAPACLPCRVAVLHTWGSLRSWTLSGHFHETYMHDLIHINEALSGLPVDVRFISFEDVLSGALQDADVIINAGRAGDAWSGGDAWKNPAVVAELTRFVYEGGTMLGVGEPSAVAGYDTYLRMAHVLGVDEDTGARVCHGKWTFTPEDAPFTVVDAALEPMPHMFVAAEDTKVYAAQGDLPLMTEHAFGKGRGIWLSSFRWSVESTRMLLDILLHAVGLNAATPWITDNPQTEAAWFAADHTLVVLNNSSLPQTATVHDDAGHPITVELDALETKMLQVSK